MWSASARGSRLKVWKTNPISWLRTRASWSSDCSLTSSPFSQYWPSVGVSRQPSKFMRVLLPDPDGPIRATNSPRWDHQVDAANGPHYLGPQDIVLLDALGADEGIGHNSLPSTASSSAFAVT